MIQLADPPFVIEEELLPLERAMPRVFRRPSPPSFSPARKQTNPKFLVEQVQQALRKADRALFGSCYSQLLSEFQPAIEWAGLCWEYLLSTEGIRFLPRSVNEKFYHRGDFRVFTQADFNRLVHRAFKESLLEYLQESHPEYPFECLLKKRFWALIVSIYRSLEEPPDPRHRRLTPYSYLRCIPYQFLNEYHQERVLAAVRQLLPPEQQVVELYFLRFYKEEAVVEAAKISGYTLRRRRARALRAIASKDPLSHTLLTQIERY